MKKLWNKFLLLLFIKAEEWTKKEEEEWKAERAHLKAVGKYDPWAIDYGEGCWIPIRTKEEK